MNHFYEYNFKDFKIFQTPNLWQTYRNYNYIVAHNSNAIVFDPGEFAPITYTLKKNNLKLTAIYLTHHHHDHTGATEALREQWQCPVFGFEPDSHRLPPLTSPYQANMDLKILGLQSRVLFLPGHTLGLCAFHFPKQNWLFCNDALFSLGCGRVFEGTFQQMHQSLQTIAQLPDDTLLFCSHEYTAANLDFALSVLPNDPALRGVHQDISQKDQNGIPTVPTTLGFEKKHNPFLRCDEVAVRKTLNMMDNPSWQVFAELRRRKDHF